MTALQIYEQILSRTDAELLASFATEPRPACSVCGSISVRALADTATTGIGTCAQCKQRLPLRTAPYYPKQKTTSPEFAVANHRSFWTQIYYREVIDQKLRICPTHPVPDPLSAYRTKEELDLLKACYVMERFCIETLMKAPQPPSGMSMGELQRSWDRCQGVLDADSFWRGQGQLTEKGQLDFRKFANEKASINWAHGVLTAVGRLTGPAPFTFAQVAAEAAGLSN